MDLALFDLDETLICADSTGLWLRWLVAQEVASPALLQQERELMKAYYQGTMSMDAYMQLTLSPLVGVAADTVAGWAERFIRQEILPRVYPQAREAMAWHRQRGDIIVVISASGEHLVAPIARHLDADLALAIGVTLDAQRFTGAIHGTPTYRQGKVTRVQEWLESRPGAPFQRTHGYSDSMNDRALLEFVDHASVINPDETLTVLAQEHGWRICRWQPSRHPD
ncbi:HAD family hydrolase [Musicola keenii]|uniref:HAD family hydrolase n=1 Tax=Musicola keenii TaxID=2884250 RepID=UPI00177AF258|nr:HAD family hydrolase [Musicola keenii]